jgi:dihydrofolate reductase
MGVSLDGLVARPGRLGAAGWGLPPDDPALKERKLGWMHDVGLHVTGRNTYEEMAEFWPVSDDAYVVPINEIPKVVFSRTLERAKWAESRIARGDLAQEIATLKREPGKDMLAWGGDAFAQSLSRLGLVDEYRLILQPVALGQGLPLFKDLTAPLRLELVDAQRYNTGAALHVYRPALAASRRGPTLAARPVRERGIGARATASASKEQSRFGAPSLPVLVQSADCCARVGRGGTAARPQASLRATIPREMSAQLQRRHGRAQVGAAVRQAEPAAGQPASSTWGAK